MSIGIIDAGHSSAEANPPQPLPRSQSRRRCQPKDFTRNISQLGMFEPLILFLFRAQGTRRQQLSEVWM